MPPPESKLMDFDYDVVYSNRKTVRITVERDRSIVVRAPRRATPEQIAQIIQRKKHWVRQKMRDPQKYDQQEGGGDAPVSGETVRYLGRSYRLEVDAEHAQGDAGEGQPPSSVRFDGHRFHLPACVARQAARQPLEAWLKRKAHEKIVPIAEEIASSMGVTYARVLVSDLQYRWGSCTPSGTLNFNWRLVQAPVTVIRYVVAHELAHLLEPNHTPRFWRIVHVQAPHYGRAKAWLREHGGELETVT